MLPVKSKMLAALNKVQTDMNQVNATQAKTEEKKEEEVKERPPPAKQEKPKMIEVKIRHREDGNGPKFDDVFTDEFLFEQLLDFFSFEEIFTLVQPLNKTYQRLAEEANYLLLRKLADKFYITSGYLTTDLPAHQKIVDVYNQALEVLNDERELNLKPTGFYTDAGLVGTNMWYSFHNIFDTNTSNMYGGYVFSSNNGYNNHIQFYLCVPGAGVDNTFCTKLKKMYEVEPASKEIRVPYQLTPDDGSMPTFKIPKVFEINCKNQGYCYYADNIVL